jgi:hypothetical protein
VYGLFVTDSEVVATALQTMAPQQTQVVAVALGGGTPKVAATGLDTPYDVVALGGAAYWTDIRTNQQDYDVGILTAPLQDGGSATLLYGPSDIGLDLGVYLRTDGTRLYFQTAVGELLSAEVDGSGTSVLLSDGELGFFTLDGAEIYAATSKGIVSVATAGGLPATVVAGAQASSIAVGEKDVVWFDGAKNQILRASK